MITHFQNIFHFAYLAHSLNTTCKSSDMFFTLLLNYTIFYNTFNIALLAQREEAGKSSGFKSWLMQ
jgi:hypothetical protein